MTIPALLQFAEYSNMMSIAVVLVCFVMTSVFIYFFRTTDFPQRPVSIFDLKQRNMVKATNPFVLHLEGGNSKLQDGLMLSLSALCPSRVVALWGPKINPFHDLILLPGSEIYSKCLKPTNHLRDLEALHIDILKYRDPGKHTIVLPCPEGVSCSSLGEMPRQRYPLALFVFISKHNCDAEVSENNQSSDVEHSDSEIRTHNSTGEDNEIQSDMTEEPNSIVGLISVIHIRDEVVTQASHVICHYVKTAGVAIYSLQPLFMSTDPHENEIPSTETKKSSLQKASLNKDTYGDCSSSSSLTSEGDNTQKRTSAKNHESESAMRETQVDNGASCVSDDGSNQIKFSAGIQSGHKDEEDKMACLSDCVVCQSRPVACVILSCRHTSVCFQCLKLLDKCPLCRGPINSYFMLNKHGNEEDADDESEDDELIEGMQRDAVAWNVTRMLERLNEMLGFR